MNERKIIYLDDAVEAITQYLGRMNRNFESWEGTARIILDHVPSAQPEPHWIPCSERLPDKEEKYLVTDTKTVDIDIFTHSGNGTPMWFLSDNVTAWMPLPEPYREDGEQE